MSSKHCWYRECKSDSRYNDRNLFYFIPFPKPCLGFRKKGINESLPKHLKHCGMCEKANAWLHLCYPRCGPDLNKIKKWSYICSLHFVGQSGPTEECPDPLMYTKKMKFSVNRGVRLCKTTKRTRHEDYDMAYAPSTSNVDNMQTVEKEVILRDHLQRMGAENYPNVERSDNDEQSFEDELSIAQYETEETITTMEAESDSTKVFDFQDFEEANISTSSNLINASTETDLGLDQISCSTQTMTNAIDKSTQAICSSRKVGVQTTLTVFPHMRRLNYYKRKCEILQAKLSERKETAMQKFEYSLKMNKTKSVFYTGLDFDQILTLFRYLGPAVTNLKYWKSKVDSGGLKTKSRKLTPLQELLLVLVRLRRGFLVTDLAFRFGLSAGLVSKLTITWIQLMFHEFNNLRSAMFPSRKKISETLPAVFQKLRNIRVIVDCTEFFCETPSNYEQQGNLYSQYKAHTTFKVLIGCTPNGGISYVSDLFEGAISDRQLFEQCGIVDLLEPNDLVLADRGFTVNDVVQSKGAHLNIPPFLKGRNRLTPQEEIETKKIAKQRIFVEHAIGRLKTFRLLTRVIPLSMRGIISQTVFVCACLVNFGTPIVMD